jgi:hypothetical protein
VQLSLSPSLRSADVRGPHGSVISYLKTARRQYDGPLKEVAALILGSSWFWRALHDKPPIYKLAACAVPSPIKP